MSFVVLWLLVRAYYPVAQWEKRPTNIKYESVFVMHLRDDQCTDGIKDTDCERSQQHIYWWRPAASAQP